MRRMSLLALLAIATPVLAVPTPAVPFEVPLPGTSAAAEPGLAGTVISDKVLPFTIANANVPVSGTLQVRVVRNASGKLAFYWKINNAATSKAGIESLSFGDFPKQAYDANWRNDGLGTVAPSTAVGMYSVGDLKTWVTGFYFKAPVKPGESSRFFFLRSGATASVPAVAHLVGSGGGVGEVPALAPAS